MVTTTTPRIPSLHIQYKSEALAWCVGDVLFFRRLKLIGSIKNWWYNLEELFVCWTWINILELPKWLTLPNAKTKLEIFSLYANKTARYTIALPSLLEQTFGRNNKRTITYLESYGGCNRVLFQIQDDALDHENKSVYRSHISGYTKAGTRITRNDEDSIRQKPFLKKCW